MMTGELEALLNRTLAVLVSSGMGRGPSVNMIVAISDKSEGVTVAAFTDGVRQQELRVSDHTELGVSDGTPEGAAADTAFTIVKGMIDFNRYSVLLGVFNLSRHVVHTRSSQTLIN